jgi:polysaccharide biosynthesis protein VpsM
MRGVGRSVPMAALGVVILAAIVVGEPRIASAQGNLEFGPFRLLLNLDLSGEYNDNILLAPRDEESDFIWTISPGVTIELPGRRWAFRLGYRADIIRYTDHSELDTVDHTVQAGVKATFNRLNLSLLDEFKKTENFAGFPVPELTTRVERHENLLHVDGEYRVADRWSVGAHYDFLLVDYVDDPQFDELDHQEHTVGAVLFYRLTSKLSALGEYDYQFIRYRLDDVAADRDSDSHFIKVGLKGDLTAKTSAAIKFGYQWKNYDNPAREDFDGPVVEAEVIWKYREPSQLRIYGGRANVESTFEGNNFFIATYGGVELKHYITSLLLLTARGLAGTNSYPETVTVGTETKERDDWFYEVGVSVRYQLRRWLALELAYQFLRRDSNFSDFDYTNNRVIGTVHLTY